MSKYPETVFDERLKPCPFCGSTSIVIEGPEFDPNGEYGVMCDEDEKCWARMGSFPTADGAIEAWNRRTS